VMGLACAINLFDTPYMGVSYYDSWALESFSEPKFSYR
jgi:hypothetical protein